MQEIGTWTTAEGTVTATLQLESEIGDDAAGPELPAWASGALSGALGGAASGAAAGPWGALIGAGVGAAVGGATAATAPKPPPPPKPPPSAASTPPASPPSAPASDSGSRTTAIQALQQFAAAVPALIQLVAASRAAPAGTKPSESWAADGTGELIAPEGAIEADEWTSYSEYEGAWTVHD
jgi:hypothetical protein